MKIIILPIYLYSRLYMKSERSATKNMADFFHRPILTYADEAHRLNVSR